MDSDKEEHERDDHAASTGTGDRLSEDRGGVFHRLPLDVIQKILYTVDANTFASLTVLNQQWRKASDSPELYAHHLSRCPLFTASHQATIPAPINSIELGQLKQMFAREVRKNAFQLFLRPRKTLVTLISSSVGSSAALPTGEALKFDFSPNGHILLCLSSSRIFVLDLAAPEITVLYELKTSRMPLAATILDDGRVLAVVSHRHQVNIYHLSKNEAKHVQVLTLNDVPRALALTPSGSVLGIAYDGSIEVHALGEDVIATQCRAVRCGKIDTLSFSMDGSMLLGSSLDRPDGGFVTITAPFPTDSMVDVTNYEAHIWTTQILFPEVVSGYSHVALLSSHGGDDNWIIGFDNELQTFRAVRPCDPKNGSTYFLGPASPDGIEESLPSLSPAIVPTRELVALAFRGSGLWLYGLPDDVSQTPLESNETARVNGTTLGIQSPQSPSGDYNESVAVRLGQILNQPTLMIEGRKMADIPGLTAARWVARRRSSDSNISSPQRLVAVAPGGVTSSTLGDESIPVDGGRISIFDFQASTVDGETVELTIELGEEEPLVLRETYANLEQEVELERRRTQMRRGVTGLPRADPGGSVNSSRQSYPDTSNHRKSQSLSSSQPAETEVNDVTLFLEGPYSNTAPRSRDTLQRAATAAASNRRPQHPIHQPGRPRLPTLQIPHESDADNWVPPPPPYTRDADEPLPEHLRQLLLPAMTAPPGGAMDDIPHQMRRANTNLEDRPERSSSVGASGILSRRWSTRRRSADTSNDSTNRRGLNFTPLSMYRNLRPLTRGSESNIEPVPPIPSTERDNILSSSTAPRQIVRQSPTDSGTTPSSAVPRRQFRSSRIFGNLRKTGNDSPASQTSEQQQQQSVPNPSPRRNRSVMRSGRFSRSSPNLALGSSGINRMSTIYSNASRSAEQNGQVRRTRSRSEVAQPPAPLTEEALQSANDRQSSRIPSQLTPMHNGHGSDQQQQQPQQQSASDADWQHPNLTESDEWRARIEAWNMNTISERKRSRSKNGRCIVM